MHTIITQYPVVTQLIVVLIMGLFSWRYLMPLARPESKFRIPREILISKADGYLDYHQRFKSSPFCSSINAINDLS